MNVEMLRFASIEYLEAIVAVGEQHLSGMYDSVLNHVMTEYPADDILQAMDLYRQSQEEDGWGADLELQALSFRFNACVRLYVTLTDADVNGANPRSAPVVHVFGPANATCTAHILASRNHFDPLVVGQGAVRLKLTRPVYNVVRAHVDDTTAEPQTESLPEERPGRSSRQGVTRERQAELAAMTCDQHAQAFFHPSATGRRKPREHVVTVTFARREHDLNDSDIAAFDEWLKANQNRFPGACASTERGRREGRLHVQCALHLRDFLANDESGEHLRLWLRKHLKLSEGEGYALCVNVMPVTLSNGVTWAAQAGYTKKEVGQPHYRVVHQHGETAEWFRNSLFEYETTAAAMPYKKRFDIKPRNVARLMVEFERREMWPGSVFLASAQVLRFMLLTGNYQMSSDFVTFAKGINVVALDAIRWVDYCIFSGMELEVEAIQAVLQSHDQTGTGLRHNSALVDSRVGPLFDAFGGRNEDYDERTLAGMRTEVRHNRSVQRGDRIDPEHASPVGSAAGDDDDVDANADQHARDASATASE